MNVFVFYVHQFASMPCTFVVNYVRVDGKVHMRREAHLEADFALLATEAGQHEEHKGEEPREGNGHNSQG